MYVVIFQHDEGGLPGTIEEILIDRNVDYAVVKTFNASKKEMYDCINEATHLIMLGGYMGAYEEDKYPFLREEMEIIRKFVIENRPVLGICLGSQLLARSMGSRVFPYKKELGWFRIQRVQEDPIMKGIPKDPLVFQWHKDSYDLPEGAKLLYAGNEVPNQVFKLNKAIGVQFHPEITKEILQEWIKGARMRKDEQEHILTETDIHLPALKRLCRRLIGNFLTLR